MLDVEVVAGICPKATIVVYFAHFTEHGWITILDAAMQDKAHNPGVLSISWGFAEDALIWTRQAMAQVNEAMKEAAMLGITICVAAGDDGSSDAISDGHAHADFPASSPYVLAVGGTTIPTKGGAQPDICWKEGDGLRADNGGSTGGGISAVFPRPNWQEGIKIPSVNPGAIVGRCIPDIAANADWNASPYLLVVDGGAQPNGGTSAAAPLWAALVALINQARGSGKRIGYLTPLLYQSVGGGIGGPTIGQAGCRDVVSGDNVTAHVGGYHTTAGYDAASGWGTPDGKKLLAALANH
jgi:kumamolisin